MLEQDLCTLNPFNDTIGANVAPSGTVLIIDVLNERFLDDSKGFKRNGSRERDQILNSVNHFWGLRVDFKTIHCHIAFEFNTRMLINLSNVW